METQERNPHQKAMELLQTQLNRGVLPHAHLFIGPEGVGRADAARSIARAVFCTEKASDSCGICRACKAFASGNHPDYHEFARPEGRQSLPIGSIRSLQLEASRKPVMGNQRVFVIRDAESMSLEAANCFLKTLEEPPGECYIILIASALRDLPETIVSRCQVTKLTCLRPETVKQRLCEQGVDAPDAAWLAARSWGSPEKAGTFHAQKLHAINRNLVEKLVSMRMEENFAMSDYLQSCARKMGENASEQRMATQELLECVAMIYRDLAALINDPGAGVFNEHCRDELARCAGDWELDAALECADRALVALERIGANVNRRLVLDQLFSDLPLF